MPGLDTPVWIIQTAIPLGFVSAPVRYFIFTIWSCARRSPLF